MEAPDGLPPMGNAVLEMGARERVACSMQGESYPKRAEHPNNDR